MGRGVSFTLLVLGITATLAQTEIEHPFVIFAPREIGLGEINDLTLVCQSDNIAAFDVTIQLRYNSTEVLYSQDFRKSGSSLRDGQVMLKFTPPDNIRGGHNLTAEVEVRTRDRRRMSYFAHTYVNHKRQQANFVYIQLDKPIYKPNENVNYRIVAVEQDLTPLSDKCNIIVKDSRNNIIDDIRNAELKNGVSSHILKLSDQPNLGSWMIDVVCANRSRESKSFKVEEYVLPKFEVELDAPKYVMVTDQRVKVRISAQYTFGKGVDGKAHISFRDSNTLRPWYRGNWDRIARKYVLPPTVEFKDVELEEGKGEVEINMKQLHYIFNCRDIYDGRELTVLANVTESLTGIVRPGQTKIQFSTRIESLSFVASPSNYKAGFDYTGFLKLNRKDGGVVQNPKRANISVSYYIGFSSTINELCTNKWIENGKAVENHLEPVLVSFPENGIAEFRIRIPEEAVHKINIKATYMDGTTVENPELPKEFYNTYPLTAHQSAQQSLSETDNFIQVGMKSGKAVQAGERVEFQIDVSDSRVTVYYHILARGNIVLFNEINMRGSNSKTISLDITTEMAPSANIFVYYILEDADELIVDSLSFKVSGIFKHNVSLSFSDSSVAPGNSVSLTVKSQPRSFVGVVAVDQSVLLLGEGNDISQDDVSEDVNRHFGGNNYWSWRYYSWWYRPIQGSDAKTIIRNANLVVLTNTLVYDEREDLLRRRASSSFSGAINGNSAARSRSGARGESGRLSSDFSVGLYSQKKQSGGFASVERVRRSFPETWIWYNGTASSQGESVINAVVPDTITSWVANAFALDSRLGLGISDSTAEITVFKQFFVSLNLPYSVIRGEELVLQAIVFNYLGNDARVRVSLPRSRQFESIKVDTQGRIRYTSVDEAVEIIAKAGQGTSVYLPIVPRKVGEMILEVTAQAPNAADAVVRRLIVVPEGVERSYTRNVLIDKRNESRADIIELQQTVELGVPDHAIPDSKRIGFSLVGSILGASVENLAHLIRMPYGCGEQNLMTFATTLYVTEYLDKAGVLTTEQKDKSRQYLLSGYMRQLTYQRSDGSFSAFGSKDSEPSLFLTAYILKVFQRAMETKYTYIDPSVVSKAANWVMSQQQKDGSFYYRSRGFFGFATGGRYGVEPNVTTTAFVLSALGEVKKHEGDFFHERLQNGTLKAQQYLEGWFNNSGDYRTPNRFYNLAVTSYALKLTGSRVGDVVLDKLLTYAKEDGGWKFWEVYSRSNDYFRRRPWWGRYRYRSIEVELASYALLTYSLRGSTSNPSPALDGIPTLKWITNQRSGYGGFISTQDTVVALQALSAYALYFTGEPDLSVTLSYTAGSVTTTPQYTINNNKLVLQQRTLPAEVTEASLLASGTGLALGMFSVSYNEEEDEVEPSFDTRAEVEDKGEHSLSVSICTKYLQENTTGMAVMEIGVPSGFSTSEDDLKVTEKIEELDRNNNTVIAERRGKYKRFENADRKFILYFDQIRQLDTCIHFKAQRTGLVAKSQPVAVRIYDYYDPENQQTIFYASQRLKETSICDVCPDCENCI